ncbi:TolC family protein [Algibacillus agarilyticus]|uniref:TolC family protein n=1 Tax=Algibacillus agarilyticus TaxID=2234133 RepID=UPI000DCF84A6|nr:TolC family protein [Algibacillus agarilyticus]
MLVFRFYKPILLFCTSALITSCSQLDERFLPNSHLQSAPEQWQTTSSTFVATNNTIHHDDDYWGIKLNQTTKTMLEQGLNGNQQLKIAMHRMTQAKAEHRATHANALPSLRLKASQRVNQTIDSATNKHTQNLSTVGLLASWEPDIWSKLADETRADWFSYQAQHYNLAAAELSVEAQILTAWLNWLEQSLLLTLNNQHETNLKHRLEMSLIRLDNGLASSLDIRNAQTSLYRLHASSEALRLKRDMAERDLKVLMGEYPKINDLLSTELPILDTLPAINTPHSILLHRPDILAAEANLIASGYSWQATEKRKLPSLSIDYTFDVKSSYAPKLFDLDYWLHAITASLVQPLFYQGQLTAVADKAQAQHHIALQQYKTALLKAWQEVENNLQKELSYQLQYNSLDQALVQAKSAETQTELHYSQGLVSSFELLAAQRTRYNIEADQIKMQVSRIKNRIQLSMSLGLPKNDLPQVK